MLFTYNDYKQKLKDTIILRGGATASYISLETRNCIYAVDGDAKALGFQFSIASKGGGDTTVRLVIGKKDFSAIFRKIAKEIPDTENVFLTSASYAYKTEQKLLLRALKKENKALKKELKKA